MTLLQKKLLLTLALGSRAAVACAASVDDITWIADLGSTGVGVHASIPLSMQSGLHARLGVNYLSHYAFSRNTSQVAYDFKASLRTLDALLDWHPWRNGFRVTTGVIYNHNVIDALGTPNRVATFSFENDTFSTTQIGKIVGQIDFPSMAPYFGIGWQSHDPDARGWNISTDLGVMYQGSPRTTLGVSGCSLPGNGCSLAQMLLAPAIVAETQRLDEQLKHYRYFPVMRIGASYRF